MMISTISMGLLFHPSSNACVMIMASSSSQPPRHNNLRQQKDFVRPLAKFPEKIPGDRFSSFTLDQQVHDEYAKEIQPLKEETRKMLMEECNAVDKLYLIDNIERLGISYHFEDEIEDQLQLIFNQNIIRWSSTDARYSDLSTVALQFRLFRQHGYAISSDVFEQFTYGNGKFSKSLQSDAEGLLNLYEAACVRTRKDVILDEALTFTTNYLKERQKQSNCELSNYIKKLVKHALYQCLHRGTPRLEAHHFICAYDENEEKNMSLLRFAKLDFNSLQLMYKQELSASLRWWKELDTASKIPHTRNILVESYFFAVAMLFEPKYSTARLTITKYLATGVFIDDSYDAYGTIDELEIFTDAILRWDLGEADRLPEYLKNAYTAFIKVNEEIEEYATQQGRPYAFHYVKEAWKEYVKNSNIQSGWFLSKDREKLPSFDEYMVPGLVTAAGKLNACILFVGMESATGAVFEWLFNHPPMLKPADTIHRLVNDVCGHERGSTTPVDIYMKSFNVSEEEAKRRLMEMVEDAWKDFNEEHCRKPTMPITREVWRVMINQTRLMDVLYKNGVDGWTDTQNSVKPFINQMFVDPFTI